MRRLPAIAAGVLLATAVPATAAVPDQLLVKRNVSIRNAAVAGAPDLRAAAGTGLAFPRDWRLTKRTPASFTLREGARNCQYTIRATVRVATGDEADAVAHAAAALPATGRFVIESGTRGAKAWRVIRVPERRSVHLEGIAVDPLGSFVTQRAGRKLWMETRVSARSDTGDECHAGTWRDTAGPRIGDALATERGRAFLMS